jgi:hypothetical protein
LLAPVLFLLLLISHLLAPLAWAEEMTVYRSASCGCCKGWINHIRDNGIKVEDVVVEDVHYFKNKLGVPNNLRSCHTGVINGYVIEGHVPAAEIKQLLKEKQPVLGLAVPAMPVGTPGMEMGDRKDPFDVVSFDKMSSDGKVNTRVFKEYRDY